MTPTPRVFPVRFTPRGLTDALDATDKFPGACTALTNLIFDQANPEIMVSRPGVSEITAFPGFIMPDVVSAEVTIGSVTYGMIGTGLNANKDEPFAYDHATSAFLPITGVVNANCPTTQPSSGPWTPPTMASVGVYIIVTHPGFAGAGTMFGWFDITNPAAPVWTAGDTATNGLPSVPKSVANFNNRAYFACGNTTPYTDVLTLTRTSASQALTIGDASAVTALSGLPVQTTSSGIVQAMIVFKAFQTWQVTGDSAASNLALNYISLTVGCSAPRSIAQSPLGLYFAAFSMPMVIDQLGMLRSLTHSAQQTEPDVRAAWQNALVPSRISGGYTGNIYRVCMQTIINGIETTNDYWFDELKRRWTGPHSFPYDSASQLGNYFVISSNDSPGKLFKSEFNPSIASVYSDDGTITSGTLTSSTFPKEGLMSMKQVVESTLELSSSGASTVYTVQALDDAQAVLSSAQIAINSPGSLWGAFVWGGGALWTSGMNRPLVYSIPWTNPLVFQKISLDVSAPANAALTIGSAFLRYQDCGYTNSTPPTAPVEELVTSAGGECIRV